MESRTVRQASLPTKVLQEFLATVLHCSREGRNDQRLHRTFTCLYYPPSCNNFADAVILVLLCVFVGIKRNSKSELPRTAYESLNATKTLVPSTRTVWLGVSSVAGMHMALPFFTSNFAP
ncbi:MAG: hypothetical protein RL069_1203 [Planctomycetota bacterium]